MQIFSQRKNIEFQIKKSSSSVYANIREANYAQSPYDMIAKFEIALKECYETEGWLSLLRKFLSATIWKNRVLLFPFCLLFQRVFQVVSVAVIRHKRVLQQVVQNACRKMLFVFPHKLDYALVHFR